MSTGPGHPIRHPCSRTLLCTIGIAAPLVAGAMSWFCLWITDQAIWQHIELSNAWFYSIRLGLLGAAGLVLTIAFMLCVVRPPHSRPARRCWSAAYSLVLTLLAVEAAFMFVPRSHNVGYTMAAKVWSHYFWKPVNSLGYRDHEHVRALGKKLVFVVGDSFTAGDGIADVADRYPDLLGAHHPELQILNLGRRDSDTTDELRRLQAHPLRPDVVVLQYYPNDIEGAAAEAGWKLPAFTPYEDLDSPIQRALVRGSFLANFFYWQFPHTDGLAYVDYLERALGDPGVLCHHYADLERFCTCTESRGTPLVVVMFPILNDLAHSRVMTAGVKDLFVRHGVRVVDVAGFVENVDILARTVNRQNAHPSALVHALVAEALGSALVGL